MAAESGRTLRIRTIAAWLLPCALVVCGCALTASATAQTDEANYAAGPLAGTLKRIRQAGVIRLGYRDSAIPFSYASRSGEPYGYSIDLCKAIAEEITEVTGGRPLRTEFRRVTPENRVEAILAGNIQLECGSTSITPERRKHVAFSPQIFITGTKVAVPRSASIRSISDLAGRRIAVAKGTTNEAVLRRLIDRSGLNITLVAVADIAEAFAAVTANQADAVASDDVLLYGYLAEHKLRSAYAVTGRYLSYETYGIMYPAGDAALAAAVNRALARLAASGELRNIYNRWFMRPLPSGVRLDLPMSRELQRAFEILGQPAE